MIEKQQILTFENKSMINPSSKRSRQSIHINVCLTDVVEVVGAPVEEPVSVVVTAEAQRRRGAVPLVDDTEPVWTLGQVVVDDHILIRLCEYKKLV